MFSTCTLCFKQQRKIFFAPLCVQYMNRIIEKHCKTRTFAVWIAILLKCLAKAYEIKISNHLINIPTFIYWLFKLNILYLFLLLFDFFFPSLMLISFPEIGISHDLSLRYSNPWKMFCNWWLLGFSLSNNLLWATTRKWLHTVQFVSRFIVLWIFDWLFNGSKDYSDSLCL